MSAILRTVTGWFARSKAPATPNTKGSRGKRGARGYGGAASSWGASRKLAEKLYGPHNPKQVSDETLALMGCDWTLGLALDLWKSAYQRANYWVEGPSKELNAYVLALWDRRQAEFLRVLLHALQWGRSTSEIVWGLEDVAYTFVGDEGEKVERVRRGDFTIAKLRDYDPRQVRVLAEERTGDYAGFRLRDQDLEFAKWESVHTTNDPAFGNLLGRSLLLNSYTPWWRGNHTYLQLAQYLEKKGDPPYFGYAPSEEVVDEDNNTHDPIATTAIGLANLRAGGNYVLPGEFDPETKQRMYEVREAKIAERAQEFLPVIQQLEAMKAIGALTSPDLIAGGKAFAGAKVAHRVQSDMFATRHESLILQPVNRWIIPKSVRYNFGASVRDSDMPRLKGGRLADNAIEVMAEIVRSNQQAVSVTAAGQAVPVASRIDYKRALDAMGIPQVDEARIPEGLSADGQRPQAGQPPAIAPNPKRPPGPTERGMSRVELASELTPAGWLAAVHDGLDQVDVAVARAAEAVDKAHLKTQKALRSLLTRAVKSAESVTAADGRVVISTRNRRLGGQVRKDAEHALAAFDVGLLDPAELTADRFAGGKLTPLAQAHVDAATAARETLARIGLPLPGSAAAARLAKDVVRDARTNSRGQVTREGRRIQELVDRWVQGGNTVEDALRQAADYVLPQRDIVSSTVAHVRATARATFGSKAVLASKELDGWAVVASKTAATRALRRWPSGKVADMLWRTWPSTQALDEHFVQLVAGGRPQTSWRNLGRNFFSEEMYLPIPVAIAGGVLDLLAARRQDWNARRRAEQERLDALARPESLK